MKTALCVKDGPPLVPAVKPTTVKTSGPGGGDHLDLLTDLDRGADATGQRRSSSPWSIATSDVFPGSGSRPATTVTLRSAALEFCRPTRVTASPDEAAAGRAGSDLLLVQRDRLHDAREVAERRDLGPG